MKQVPKRNIEPRLSDIRPPPGKVEDVRPSVSEVRPEAIARILEAQPVPQPFAPAPPAARVGRFIAGFLTLALLVVLATFFESYRSKAALFKEAVSQYGEAAHAVERLTGAGADGVMNDPFRAAAFEGFGTAFWPILKTAGGVYQSLAETSASALSLVQELSGLADEGLGIVFGTGEDNALAPRLRALRERIDGMNASLDKFREAARDTQFSPFDSADYLAHQIDLARAEKFLDALIPWVEDPADRHLLVLFENPSELRPGGGFVGSYADVTLSRGRVRDLDVRDINDPDREFDAKIVPPQPLQAIAKRWRAADANWFFDFPASAAKTVSFLEQSDLYASSSIGFEGAIGLSARAVGEFLDITGSLTLPGSGRMLTSDNFLTEIQREVQAGRAAGSGSPKEILRTIAPQFIQKLASLSPEERKMFFLLTSDWVRRGDLRVYLKHPPLQEFLDAYDLTGRVFRIPEGWNGDYVAVVHANVGGGKTDLFMKRTVTVQSQLSEDGTVSSRVTVRSTHEGKNGGASWYEVPNMDYLSLFTLPNAHLDGASGGMKRTIQAPVNYAAQQFVRDPDVQAVESTREDYLGYPTVSSYAESGKNVFRTWVRTPLGGTSEVSFDYAERLFRVPAEGGGYEFVFENQSGARGTYRVEISAPVGYRFRENRLPVFEYETSDPPRRITLNLTLERSQ